MTDARTEPSMRGWAEEQLLWAEKDEANPAQVPYTRSHLRGRIEAYKEFVAEIDRRDAAPTVTTLDDLIRDLPGFTLKKFPNESFHADWIGTPIWASGECRYEGDSRTSARNALKRLRDKLVDDGVITIAAVESAAKGGV